MPKKRKHQDTRLSLHPMSFEDAVRALVQDEPKHEGSPAEASRKTRSTAPASETPKRRTSRRRPSPMRR